MTKKETVEKTEKKEERMKGTVKWFDIMRNYGFILGSDEKDYFVHASAVQVGVTLHEEENVSFIPAKDERGRLKVEKVRREN
jgi:CspA family cold shock protein